MSPSLTDHHDFESSMGKRPMVQAGWRNGEHWHLLEQFPRLCRVERFHGAFMRGLERRELKAK
jgi:hypothetical protein